MFLIDKTYGRKAYIQGLVLTHPKENEAGFGIIRFEQNSDISIPKYVLRKFYIQ